MGYGAFSDGDNVSGSYFAGGFGGLAVGGYFAASARFGGFGAGFKEAGGPEVFVNAEGRGHEVWIFMRKRGGMRRSGRMQYARTVFRWGVCNTPVRRGVLHTPIGL